MQENSPQIKACKSRATMNLSWPKLHSSKMIFIINKKLKYSYEAKLNAKVDARTALIVVESIEPNAFKDLILSIFTFLLFK